MNKLAKKMIKSFAYASAAGTITIGSATADLVNADVWTILYMVTAAFIFNILKELVKNYLNGKSNA